MKVKTLCAKIGEDLYWAIKDISYLQKLSLASVLEDAIELYIKHIDINDIEED